MPASISTSFAAQQSATSTLVITGVGTAFTQDGASPLTASAGTIVSQTVISDTQVSISFTAPAGPASVTLTHTASLATCAVLIRALPILELIRQNLVAAVKTISQGSGYFTSPTVQELAAVNGDANNLIVIGLGESSLVHPPVNKIYWRQTFYALCYVLPNDAAAGSAAAIDPQLLMLYADVFAAVYLDRTRGQLAYDTVIQPPQFESNAEEAQFRVSIPIQVLYRTLENNPAALG